MAASQSVYGGIGSLMAVVIKFIYQRWMRIMVREMKCECMERYETEINSIILSDAAVYSNVGDVPNQVGLLQLKEWIKQTSADFKFQGFKRLIIEGVRVQHSTSANLGNNWKYEVNLDK